MDRSRLGLASGLVVRLCSSCLPCCFLLLNVVFAVLNWWKLWVKQNQFSGHSPIPPLPFAGDRLMAQDINWIACTFLSVVFGIMRWKQFWKLDANSEVRQCPCERWKDTMTKADPQKHLFPDTTIYSRDYYQRTAEQERNRKMNEKFSRQNKHYLTKRRWWKGYGMFIHPIVSSILVSKLWKCFPG